MADDHQSAAETLVEEREDVMYPPSGGNPTLRNAHFLKPICSSDQHKKHLLLPPLKSLFSSNPCFDKVKKCMFQSYKGYPSEKWKIWVNKLKPRYQKIWKQAGIYEAILASTYRIPKDKNLILGLAERWCAETNTFIFPWGEVTITLEDVIYLGSYSVLGVSFSTPLANEFVDIFNCLKKVHYKFSSNLGQTVAPHVWMEYFICGGNQLEHEAFRIMWLSKFVLVGSGRHIALRNFHVAIHLSLGKRIALAPLVLASIYGDMRQLHNSIVESIELESTVVMRFNMCHSDLVHMWAWERFQNLRPSPNVMQRGEPRSARWNGVKILNVNNVRAALDSGKEAFRWRPYGITLSNCILSKLYKNNEQWVVVDSDDRESFARCLRVSELVGLGCIEQYLPHRVAMQFGLDQDLPRYVIRSNQSSETAWSAYNRSIRGTKLYIPPRLFEFDVSSGYAIWWRSLLAVNEEPVTSCIQNEERLPLVSCRRKRKAKSLATSSGTAERPEDYDEDDNLTIAELLLSQSRKTKDAGKRNDHDDERASNAYSGVGTPSNLICQTETVESSVWSMSFSGKCKNSKSPAERQKEPEPKEGAVASRTSHYPEMNTINFEDKLSEVPQVEHKTLDTTGCPSEFVKGRQEDDMTIAQLLSRSIDKDCFEKTRADDHEPVLNTDSFREVAMSRICKCTTRELSERNMSSSRKSKVSKSSTENPIKLEEDAVVSKANGHEMKKINIAHTKNEVVGKVNCPKDNFINIDEESSDDTSSELAQLGLKARIWRLEKMFDIIKEEKLLEESSY